MMMVRRIPALLALVTVVGSAAASSTVYKWKDANGGLHFTDTPPPAGATLISGPKVTRPTSGATPQPDCRTDISAEDCAQARAALESDAETLGSEVKAEDPATDDAYVRRANQLRAEDCEMLRQGKAAIEKRMSGESTEILTDEERAAQPAQLADIGRRLSGNCQ